MEKDIVDIVTEKEFIQLTPVEKADLQEFCRTEEEFYQLKNVLTKVGAMTFETPSPKKETKRDLDTLFAQTYPKVGPVWHNSMFATIIPKEKPFYKQPLLHVAAVALLLLLAVPMFSSNVTDKSIKIAKNENSKEDLAETKESNHEEFEQLKTDDLVVDADQLNQSLAEETKLDDALPSDDFLASRATGTARSIISMDNNQFSTGLSGTSTSSAATGNVADSFFEHPDGVFDEEAVPSASMDDNTNHLTFAISASETDDLMDLLTVTF